MSRFTEPDCPVVRFPESEDPNEFGAMCALLTATDEALLASLVGALPAYRYGPEWYLRTAASLTDSDYFHFAVVVCADAEQLAASVATAAGLAQRRNLTVLLAPAALVAGVEVPEVTVIALQGDVASGLTLLGRIVFGATQHVGFVCCDLADITMVLDDSARAEVFVFEADTAKLAIAGLQHAMRNLPAGMGHGAVLTLQHGRLSEWYVLMNMVKEFVRDDVLVIGSLPEREGETVLAAVLVATAPSARARRQGV